MKYGVLLFSVLSIQWVHAQSFTGTCSLFEPGSSADWAYVLAATEPEDVTSGNAQSMTIEVTSLPADGAAFRVAKTVANGNWSFGNAVPLTLGSNDFTVSAVAFQRSVRFQFSSPDIGFVLLQVNGEALSCAEQQESTAIGACSLFEVGPNDSWPHVLTLVTPDDPASGTEQTLDFVASSLPAGATYRVVKTVANGNWFQGNPQELTLGLNGIAVSEVAFERSVKVQFSSGLVEINSVAVNGDALFCEVLPCEEDVDDDGICDNVDGCIDVDANGICDNNEEVLDPSAFCGDGTVWDPELAQCLAAESTCEGDFDGDNAVTTGDLLAFLSVFGATCY